MPFPFSILIANSFRFFCFIILSPIFGAILWRDQSESNSPALMAAHSGIDSSDDGTMSAHSLRYRRPPFYLEAYRLHCHSCMSPYLEDQFQFISHLYRRPLVFSEKCDHGQFDWRHIGTKNCSDACVTLRMNDRVGGRRRFGFMRGCLSDIIHHNRTAVRFGELARTTKSGATICSAIRLRDLFISSDRYAFDPHDHIELCACIRSNCNSATAKFGVKNVIFGVISTMISFLLLLRPSYENSENISSFFDKNLWEEKGKGGRKTEEEKELRKAVERWRKRTKEKRNEERAENGKRGKRWQTKKGRERAEKRRRRQTTNKRKEKNEGGRCAEQKTGCNFRPKQKY